MVLPPPSNTSTAEESLFVGDLEELELVTTYFSNFLYSCSQYANAYLAQQRLLSFQYHPRRREVMCLRNCTSSSTYTPSSSSDALYSDFTMPPRLTSIEKTHNIQVEGAYLWGNLRPLRSSLHYDDQDNLLCLVSGVKTVRIMHPKQYSHTAIQCRSAFHPSANHAGGDLWDESSPQNNRTWTEYTLHPGDALYIPGGWWHQVQSSAHCFAINYWFPSRLQRHVEEYGHHYALRLIVRHVADDRMDAEYKAWSSSSYETYFGGEQTDVVGDPVEAIAEAVRRKDGAMANGLLAAVFEKSWKEKNTKKQPSYSEGVVASLSQRHPELVEYFLLHLASPCMVQLLTEGGGSSGSGRGVGEEMQQCLDLLYGCVKEENRKELTRAIVGKKEAYTRSATMAVLEQELG